MSRIFTVISIPVIAALIGWVTNYIAVKMIFRPRRVISIFGLRIHGLIPRRQREIAKSIGKTVARDLVSHADVQKVLQSADVGTDIQNLISKQLESFVTDFAGKNPMVSMFLNGPLLDQVKDTLTKQMLLSVPDFLDSLMKRVEQKLDFQKIVQEKIEGFDLSKLEGLIYEISAKELKTIEILGGVLGFLVGIIQVVIMLASQG